MRLGFPSGPAIIFIDNQISFMRMLFLTGWIRHSKSSPINCRKSIIAFSKSKTSTSITLRRQRHLRPAGGFMVWDCLMRFARRCNYENAARLLQIKM